MKKFIGCCVVLMSFCYALGVGKMTAEELDGLVDQYVLCEHGDFVRASIDELRAAERLADSELVEAFYRGMDRFKDREENRWKRTRCLDWVADMAKGEQFVRLRELALANADDFGCRAVWLYFDRIAGQMECLDFVRDVLQRNPSAGNMAWRRLSVCLLRDKGLEAKMEFRRKALEFVEKKADDPINAWDCDRILCRHRPGYAICSQRKDRLGRLLTAKEFVKVPKVREYFQNELKRMETSVK